jgi:hypothetical protein
MRKGVSLVLTADVEERRWRRKLGIFLSLNRCEATGGSGIKKDQGSISRFGICIVGASEFIGMRECPVPQYRSFHLAEINSPRRKMHSTV